MNNNTEKRVRRQQRKSSHSPQQTMATSSPPTSPQAGGLATRWGNKTVEGGTEDSTTEKQRGAWIDSSKRKLSPRSSAPDGPTPADPFAGMKTCINYQQEIERLKTLVPKVEIKKRSSQHQQQQQQQQPQQQQQQQSDHLQQNTTTVLVTEVNLMEADHNTDTDTDIAATPTTTTPAAVASASHPSLPTDHDNTTSIISSTTKMTSVPSSSSSSSSSSHISSNSSSSSLSSSHDSMSSSSLSSACSPPSSLHSIIPPASHSSTASHEIPSAHPTSDHLGNSTPSTTSNHLMEPLNNTVSPKTETSTGSSSVITDEEKARFLEFMRSWTGGLNGWNDQPMEPKGFMWNHQQPSRQSRLWTRSEPCSPLQDMRIDPWAQRQHLHHQQQQQLHHQYLQQQFHQQLPPTTIQLDMGHHHQPCFTSNSSSPLQSPLSSKSLHQQQQQLLYSSSMHPQQKQQASFHQQYQHHSTSHYLHHQQQSHSLHLHQQPTLASKEWHTSSGIKSPSSLTSQVGTIGDRSSSPSVSRSNSRTHGPLSVSVM